MLKDITFGQYYDATSVVHKCDPRVKILLMIAFIVLIFVSQNMFSLAFACVSVIFVLLISRVPIKLFLKNLKAIWVVLAFTAVINLFYSNTGKVLVSFWIVEITTGGVYRAVFMALRIILLIFISSVLTYTTTPNSLTDGIESLLSPLKYIGLKNAVHIFAMMMTIALRFIPTLIEEAEKIMNAQKARGADLENGSLVERVKALIPILIPLLISSVRRAYELAEAMECRCYNGGVGKTRMKQLTLSVSDLYAIIFIAVFTCGIIGLNIIF
ncbi:MAG: energy-coupling factor transporter transmembrane protein EcfT [Clostridia bacterium]|nr:energy-coupling factor transporter transmembrane protein EcfT [Clostridia bacterium]